MKTFVPALIAAVLASISFGSAACNVGHAEPQASGSGKTKAAVGSTQAAKPHALKGGKQQGRSVKSAQAASDSAGKRVEQDHPAH